MTRLWSRQRNITVVIFDIDIQIYMYTIVEQLNCHFHITIYHTQAEYAKHYIIDSVSSGK
jgi:hypothetical protein